MSDLSEFVAFPKIPRLYREIVITEKLDGTNGCVVIDESGNVRAASRNQWITPENDNYGFAKWVESNKFDLLGLGAGRHFGEWYGQGIQRNYGLSEKRFALFKRSPNRPDCCEETPMLYQGVFYQEFVDHWINKLFVEGSIAAPGFMRPEGIVIYHVHARKCFKVLIENDSVSKGASQ